jgi:polysaccharide pyruvyl transferase WcaK-like protein
MDPFLARMCARYCKQSLAITRNEQSQAVLGKLGMSTELGTDTAWTFEPLCPDYGYQALCKAGWDRKKRVLVVCPINPFWWPVKASIGRFIAKKIAAVYKDSHYRSIYFHKSGREVTRAYENYLMNVANAVHAFRKNQNIFVITVAMEMLDMDACQRLSALLGGIPIFSSNQYDMYQVVSILRCCHMMVSSRYHGIVASMPAKVISAGITMDERIRNLMQERGHKGLLLEVNEPDLEEKLYAVMQMMEKDQDAIGDRIGHVVVNNLKLMARMGMRFVQELQRHFPDFSPRNGLRTWGDYLPPLSPTLLKLVEQYGSDPPFTNGIILTK